MDIPSVEELEFNDTEAYADSLSLLPVKDIQTASVRPVVLGISRRKESSTFHVRLAVEIVGASSAPSPVSADQLKLTFSMTEMRRQQTIKQAIKRFVTIKRALLLLRDATHSAVMPH